MSRAVPWGRDVVEEAAVLVIADDKCGLFHTAGLDSKIRSAVTMDTAPSATGRAGCSDCRMLGTNQETLGSRLALTSAAKSPG